MSCGVNEWCSLVSGYDASSDKRVKSIGVVAVTSLIGTFDASRAICAELRQCSWRRPGVTVGLLVASKGLNGDITTQLASGRSRTSAPQREPRARTTKRSHRVAVRRHDDRWKWIVRSFTRRTRGGPVRLHPRGGRRANRSLRLRATHRRFEGRHRETLRRVPRWPLRSAERACTP
jgi:hypothetical protein